MKFDALYESFAHERDIENLAKAILDNYADLLMRMGVDKSLVLDKVNKVKWIQALDFEQILFETKFKAKTPELKELLKSNYLQEIIFTNGAYNKPRKGIRGQYGTALSSWGDTRTITLFYSSEINSTVVVSWLTQYNETLSDNRYKVTKDIPVKKQLDSTIYPNTPKYEVLKKGTVLFIKDISKSKKEFPGYSFIDLDTYEAGVGGFNDIGAFLVKDKDIKSSLKQLEAKADESILELIHKVDVMELLNLRYTTLVHELTHMLDDFQSEGKALEKKQEHKDDYKEYLRLPHEINARFTQTVSNEQLVTQKLRYPSHSKRGGFKNYLDIFKLNYLGWHDIDEKDRKHLIKRLFTDYMQISKEDELALINNGFNKVFWPMALEPNKRVDWKTYYKTEKRLKADIKKIGHQIVKAVVARKMKLPVLLKTYEGVIRAMYHMFDPKGDSDPKAFQKEFKLTDDQIIELGKRVREYGNSKGFYLF